MALAEQLAADLKSAMIGGDGVATTTLRLLKAELQNAEISAGHELSDEEIRQVIRKEVKKRKESASTYRSGGSEDRAVQEETEAKVLEKYLPAMADQAAIEEYVNTASATAANKGELIRQTIAHFAGTADGKTVSEIVNRLG